MKEKEQQTASELMAETFNKGYKAMVDYCDWVMKNNMTLDLHNKLMGFEEPNYYDEGLIELPLRL